MASSKRVSDHFPIPSSEEPVDLVIGGLQLEINGRAGTAIAVNGSVPGPLVRVREGNTAVFRVTNRLSEITSIHWHGILLPPDIDGVPGVSFAGIDDRQRRNRRPPGKVSETKSIDHRWWDRVEARSRILAGESLRRDVIS